MKKFLVLFYALVLFACSKDSGSSTSAGETAVSVPATPAAVTKKYGVKSGIVHYEFGSKMASMTKVLYFDDFGMKECHEMLYDGKLTEIQFSDGESRFTVRIGDDKKVAWNQGKAYRGIALAVKPSEMKNQKGVIMLPNMSILGKDCDAYSIKTSSATVTFAGWQGVLMLMQSDDKNGAFDKAVKAEFDVPVPVEKFRVPDGYEVKSM
jgi:hypothetical protein